MIAVHRIDYQRYARPRFLSFVFVTALLFMLLTFFVGVNLNSASRWIRIPLIGVTFQPSDFLRIALIAILARQLAKRQTNIHRMPLLPALTLRGWRKNPDKNFNILTNITIPVLGPIVIACAAIFISNFSTAAITFCTCLIMLYVGRVRVRELWRLVALVFVTMVCAVSVMYAFNIGRSHTWVNRLGIGDMMSKTEQVKAQGEDDDLQQEQARIAIASGGLMGKGPGNSTQRSNLLFGFRVCLYRRRVRADRSVADAFPVPVYFLPWDRYVPALRDGVSGIAGAGALPDDYVPGNL